MQNSAGDGTVTNEKAEKSRKRKQNTQGSQQEDVSNKEPKNESVDKEIEEMAKKLKLANEKNMAHMRNAPLLHNNPQVQNAAVPDVKSEDWSSVQGQFGWAEIANTTIPYLTRSGEKYVCVRMAENKILDKFKNVFSSEVGSCFSVKMCRVTDAEVQLLNEINVRHCDNFYGKLEFNLSDSMILLADLGEMYEFFNFCHRRFLEKVIVPPYRCGFTKIVGNSYVPFVLRENKKYVPMFFFEQDESKPLEELAVPLSGWDLSYLKLCCKMQGIKKSFYDVQTLQVVKLNIIKHFFPPDTPPFEEVWPAYNIDGLLQRPLPKLVLSQTSSKGQQNSTLNAQHPQNGAKKKVCVENNMMITQQKQVPISNPNLPMNITSQQNNLMQPCTSRVVAIAPNNSHMNNTFQNTPHTIPINHAQRTAPPSHTRAPNNSQLHQNTAMTNGQSTIPQNNLQNCGNITSNHNNHSNSSHTNMSMSQNTPTTMTSSAPSSVPQNTILNYGNALLNHMRAPNNSHINMNNLYTIAANNRQSSVSQNTILNYRHTLPSHSRAPNNAHINVNNACQNSSITNGQNNLPQNTLINNCGNVAPNNITAPNNAHINMNNMYQNTVMNRQSNVPQNIVPNYEIVPPNHTNRPRNSAQNPRGTTHSGPNCMDRQPTRPNNHRGSKIIQIPEVRGNNGYPRTYFVVRTEVGNKFFNYCINMEPYQRTILLITIEECATYFELPLPAVYNAVHVMSIDIFLPNRLQKKELEKFHIRSTRGMLKITEFGENLPQLRYILNKTD